MPVVAHSQYLLNLVDPDVAVERLAGGFGFTEGPIWNCVEAALYFNDLPGDAGYRWSVASGMVKVRHPNNKANGMTYDARGHRIVCEHTTSSVVRESAEGDRQVLASHFGGKELNSPNDVVVGEDGSIYFTDPTYGRTPGFGIERQQELNFQGLYRIQAGDGPLELLADDFEQPNGLCFSPDGSRLFVNDTARVHVRVFSIDRNGIVTDGSVFKEISRGTPGDGVPDGMKCDAHGNLYVSGPGGIWIIAPDGEHLGVVEVPEVVGNFNWGGCGWSTLYITASTSLYAIAMKTPGAPAAYMGMGSQ